MSPPPKHAVNRGIVVEGLCSILSGSVGACLGVTSYSTASGVIAVTGVCLIYKIGSKIQVENN